MNDPTAMTSSAFAGSVIVPASVPIEKCPARGSMYASTVPVPPFCIRRKRMEAPEATGELKNTKMWVAPFGTLVSVRLWTVMMPSEEVALVPVAAVADCAPSVAVKV